MRRKMHIYLEFQREKRERRIESLFKEAMAEAFPEWIRVMNFRSGHTIDPSQGIKKATHTGTHLSAQKRRFYKKPEGRERRTLTGMASRWRANSQARSRDAISSSSNK